MRSHRLALTLSALNLLLLAFIMAMHSPLGAKEPPGLLRGRALELVDENGQRETPDTRSPRSRLTRASCAPTLGHRASPPLPPALLAALDPPVGARVAV